MPIINYQAAGFPIEAGEQLAGSQSLVAEWSELAKAATTVGRASMVEVLQHGVHSVFEIIYRAAMLFANVRETDSGHLARTTAYKSLDPSEKSAVSYYLGLTMAKLFADRLFTTPWLMHFSVYRHQLNVVFEGRRYPDLLGQTYAGDWIVIESKGRTHRHDPDAMDRAKEQIAHVISVSGQEPTLRVASQAYFAGGHLQVDLRDPSPKTSSRDVRLPLNGEALLEAYYRPIRELFDDPRAIEIELVANERYFVRHVPEADMWVGLAERLMRDLDAGRLVRSQGADMAEYSGHATGQQTVGGDGILVRVGDLWTTSSMMLEPETRGVRRVL